MDFFQLGPIPANAITGSYYNYNLVALSYCIAVLASYVALDLTERLRAKENPRSMQLQLLLGGAFAMGAGIWSMHFIGMLAFVMPMPMQYDIFWTALSMVVAIIASGFALFILRKENSLSYMALGGILIGLGIASMHYIGMYAMEGHVTIHYLPSLFIVSILVAIFAAEAALWLALRISRGHFRKHHLFNKIVGAAVMGAAICGMHYTGMAAAVFTPASSTHTLGIPLTGLTFYVAATTILITAALLASTHKQMLISAIRTEKDFLNAILYNLEDGILACDAKGKIIVLNQAMQKMTQCQTGTTFNLWIDGCALYHPNSQTPLKPEERPLYLALHGEEIHSKEFHLRNPSGHKHDVIVDGQPIMNSDGKIRGAVMAFHDVTEQKKMQYQLMVQATHDMLTGLPNRVLLLDRIRQGIKAAKRNNNLLAILFLDIDRFKSINDRFGHASGDDLLMIVAKRLASCIRQGDTVARLGGDEFVVVLSALKTVEAVAAIAQKILHKLGEPFDISDHHTTVTASIGVSLYPTNGDHADTLLQKADAAMYRVKTHNRNHVRFYSEDMNIRTIKRNELEQYLYEAIDNKQFIVYYQPIIDMQKGNIIGCEALLRWQHPTLGLLLPADFLSLTEETGHIVKIGEWVLNTTCAQNKAWQDQGFSPIRIAVNVSSLQFMGEDFYKTVEHALNTSKMDPRYLELELTESIILKQPEQALQILRKLKEIGVNIALDDFGIGYSCLGYLSRLPVNKIKIDRSFVHDIAQHSENAAIVLAIIKMASSMKLKVTAEGMETESELAFLRFNRCDEVQGFYFSMPLPAEEFTVLLKEKTQYDLS